MISWGRSLIPQEPKRDRAAHFKGQIWILRRLSTSSLWRAPTQRGGQGQQHLSSQYT